MINTQKLIGPKYFGTSKKKSIFDIQDKNQPGPGAYNNHQINNKQKLPQWTVGIDNNRSTFLHSSTISNPSPQKYKLNFKSIDKNSKAMKFPQSKQQIKYHSNSEFYDANYELTKHKGSQYSFGNYYGNNYSTLPPGPGVYDVKKPTITLNKKNGLSSSDRPQPYGQQAKNPGPGQYLAIDMPQKGVKISFGKSTRSQTKFSDPPAIYYDISVKNPILRNNKPPAQIHIQKQKIKLSDGPAPNSYTIQLKNKIPGGNMDKSIRPSIQTAHNINNPCSNQYQTYISQIDKKNITFAKQIRRPQRPDQRIPGPIYQLNSTFSNIGTKISKIHIDKTKSFILPGAGHYNINKDGLVRRKAQSSIVFVADRVDFSKTITDDIGPGYYQYNQVYKSTYGKISKGSRNEPPPPSNNNPGVGNYQIPNNIGKLPVYCIAPKKLSQTGYSVFYQKKQQRLNKQKMRQLKKQSNQIRKQSYQDINPQQISNNQYLS